MTDTFIKLPHPIVKERNSITVTAYFRDAANAAEAPSTIHYRIDDLTTNTAVKAWTSVSAASSAAIVVLSAENRIVHNGNKTERRQITVSADKGTTTETRDTAEWFIDNIGAFDES